MLRRLAASRRPTAAAGAGLALVRRAGAAAGAASNGAVAASAAAQAQAAQMAVVRTGARLASTLVVPPQYTGIETITRSEVGETMTRERLQNMIANPPRARRVQLAEKGVAHGRGGRKHTVANVWIRALNPLDSPYVCKDMLSAKHPGVCQRMAAGTPCYFEHPSAEQIAEGAARVRNGTGNDIVVNAQPYHEYFRRWAHRGDVTSPLLLTSMLGRFKVNATVKGGGLTGQAQAVRHGLARALQAYNPLLRPALKLAGLLRRDDRVVERKKWGQKKARKKFTWVKR